MGSGPGPALVGATVGAGGAADGLAEGVGVIDAVGVAVRRGRRLGDGEGEPPSTSASSRTLISSAVSKIDANSFAGTAPPVMPPRTPATLRTGMNPSRCPTQIPMQR